MRINQTMAGVTQVDIKQENLDYSSDEANENIYNNNAIVKSEFDEKLMLTSHNPYDRFEESLVIKKEIDVEENGEMQSVSKYSLHTQFTLKDATTTESENDNDESKEIPILVHSNNNTIDYTRYFKCPECPFQTSSVADFDVHLKARHNLSPEIFQCQSCSYHTKNKTALMRHFRRKHDDTSEVYNCEQCEFKTTYKPELKRHYQWKHDENSLTYVCGHCHYVTKRKHCLNRHIKMRHCDKTISLKCAYCEYTTKWNQCLRRHISAMHFGKANQNAQDGLESLSLYERNITQRFISQANLQGSEQLICALEPKSEGEGHADSQLDANVGLNNGHITSITTNNIKDRGLGITNNHVNVNNLVISNCSFPLPVLLTKNNIPSTIILVNSLNVVQKLNKVNKTNEHSSPPIIVQTDSSIPISHESEDAKQTNSTVITECGNSKIFCCEFCEYTTGSKAYLSRHQRKDHPEAIRATLRCEYCSYKSNCRSELTRHFKLKHDQNSAVFECAFCPFKTKYKPEFNRHYKLKHDESSLSFVCGFCSYCTKRRHSLIRHIKMKHNEDTETLKCRECDYTTKWKQSLKTHVRLKHASSSSRLTVQHVKEEIKIE